MLAVLLYSNNIYLTKIKNILNDFSIYKKRIAKLRNYILPIEYIIIIIVLKRINYKLNLFYKIFSVYTKSYYSEFLLKIFVFDLKNK